MDKKIRFPLSFEKFMEQCLYHPEWGYYSKAKIGRRGDFYTNVSVGVLFGELMARQFAEMWEALGKPDEFSIYEQGANDGRFAADALSWLKKNRPDCFEACSYLLIELVARLREKQKETLCEFEGKVLWKNSLEELEGESLTGIFFSNELPDSFPTHRVRFENGKWHKGFVHSNNEGLYFEWLPIENAELRAAVGKLPPIEGYTTEICLRARRWMREVARILCRGFVLTVDYGFLADELYSPERREGTLRCYHRHQKSTNPLASPDEQDITTHVDFSALIEYGEKAGLETLGFTDQHHFLIGLADFTEKEPPDAKKLRAFKTLMHPEMMGTTFKFLVQTKKLRERPSLSGLKHVKEALAKA